MLDLQQFLRTYEKDHIHIRKPVKLDHVGALVGQADDTIVFDHIQEHPGWHLVDQLFVNRKGPRPGCWAVIRLGSWPVFILILIMNGGNRNCSSPSPEKLYR